MRPTNRLLYTSIPSTLVLFSVPSETSRETTKVLLWAWMALKMMVATVSMMAMTSRKMRMVKMA